MEEPLTIFYTGGIRGDLDILPRLYTFLKHLRRDRALTPGRALFLDVGDSCAADVWHCDVTGGRSTLVVLDSMGYDAANAAGLADAESRAKLAHVVTMGLIDATHDLTRGGLALVYHDNVLTLEQRLRVVIQPQPTTRLINGTLYLGAVEHEQVGMALVEMAGIPVLERDEIFNLPPGLAPDATIAGTVEFVISEARYTQRKRDEK